MTIITQNTDQDSAGAGTVVSDEVDHFASLAAEWWDPNGDFKSLHQVNPLRMTYIRDQICRHYGRETEDFESLSNLSILDVGCGGGLICEPLARLGADVTGIDAVDEGIEVAKSHAHMMSLNIKYQTLLPEELVAKGIMYDVLINMEVIEHVADAEAFMVACATLLKPGGLMLAATLNRTLKSLALAKIMAEYILRWVPMGTHDWQKFVRPSEFCYHIRNNGMDVLDITGMQLNLIGDGWDFSKDLDVNYLITAEKPK
jgi:2-polyprenyl-6-hydroxyphenyl methylase/3-demethylubiquinone-9 3-methyltransferase